MNQSTGTAGNSLVSRVGRAIASPFKVFSLDEIVRGLTGRSGSMLDRIDRAIARSQNAPKA